MILDYLRSDYSRESAKMKKRTLRFDFQTSQAATPTAMDATVHQQQTLAALNNMFSMAQLFSMSQQSGGGGGGAAGFGSGFPALSSLGALGKEEGRVKKVINKVKKVSKGWKGLLRWGVT